MITGLEIGVQQQPHGHEYRLQVKRRASGSDKLHQHHFPNEAGLDEAPQLKVSLF